MKSSCSCKKCVECCKREPGWFLQGEIDAAARFLKLSRDEFVKKFCAEHIEDDVLCLSPRTKENSQECIFLDSKGLCKIHTVKPYECKKVMGCEKPSRHKRMREMIKRQWK